MNIRKMAATALGSAVLVAGLGLSAIPAQAAPNSVSVSTEMAAFTKAPGVSVGEVKSLKAKRTSSTRGVLNWKTPTHTGIITGYSVTVRQGNKIVKTYYTTKREQKLNGLKKGKPYYVTVSAYAKSLNGKNYVAYHRVTVLMPYP